MQNNLIIPVPRISIGEREFWPDVNAEGGEIVSRWDSEKIKVSLDYDELEKQLYEIPSQVGTLPIGAIDLYLPHLATVGIDTLIELRENEEYAFIKFQRMLSEFFRDSHFASNEQKLLHCMQEVDEGVRETEEELSLIAKKRLYSGAGVSVGLIATTLCLYCKPEVAEYVQALVGGATTIAALKHFAMKQEKKGELKRSDFYFPWLVHSKSKS